MILLSENKDDNIPIINYIIYLYIKSSIDYYLIKTVCIQNNII